MVPFRKRKTGSQGNAFLAAGSLALTLFLGSFLLFLLEPLYARLILPWFGGTSAVWTLCLAFFQTALLLGYGYADFITRRLLPSNRSVLHIGLLLGGLWFLPITPDPRWHPLPGSDPTFRVLGLLASQIGLPFFLLSASSPLIQSWYSVRFPRAKPYVLFALSNAASLLGLMAFLFLIEPNFTSKQQVALWSWLFFVYAVLCAIAAWQSRSWAAIRPPRAAARRNSSLPWSKKLSWAGLSACGSMLLSSATNHITQDVAPIPLLWVLFLFLYLLSFILVYGWERTYARKWAAPAVWVFLVLLNYCFYEPSFLPNLPLKVLVFSAGLFVGCFFCHGELAQRKPAPSQLTTYYWMISLGGAVGGLFVGLAAPRVFSSVAELPLSLVLVSGAVLLVQRGKGPFLRTVGGIITLFLVLVFAWNEHVLGQESLVRMRNFYAPLRVAVRETGGGEKYLALCNGVVVHGKQFLDPSKTREGTAYYSPESGAGLALREPKEGGRRVGLIGLGAGTLAVYGRPGDVFRFYEINPQVIRVAREYFSFLRDSLARVEIVAGDARLSLEGEPPNGFDILVVDAFSGDAVPVHLLTKEAFALYLSHLKPGGILAFHASNLHLWLAPVVKRLADDAGWPSFWVQNGPDEGRLVDRAEWVLVTRNKDFIQGLQAGHPDTGIPLRPDIRLWTDDYNSLYQILRY